MNRTALISGMVFIVLGFLFLLEGLGVLAVSARFVIPVLLVALGLGVMFGARTQTPEPPPAEPPPPATPPSGEPPEEQE